MTLAIALAIGLMVGIGRVEAATLQWVGAGFADATWSGPNAMWEQGGTTSAPPGAHDEAVFDDAGQSFITFNISPTTDRLRVGWAEVTFNLEGQTYLVSNPANSPAAVQVTGEAPIQTASLRLLGPGALQAGNVDIALADSTNQGEISVDGGATLHVSGELAVGLEGHGRLNVTEGTVDAATAEFGTVAGSQGEAQVHGPNATWMSGNLLRIGGSGDGEMTVEAGGSVSVGTLEVSRRGAMRIAGSGSTVTASGPVRLGSSTASAAGGIEVGIGGTLSSSELRLQGGTLHVKGGSASFGSLTLSNPNGGVDLVRGSLRIDTGNVNLANLTTSPDDRLQLNDGTTLSLGGRLELFPGQRLEVNGGTLEAAGLRSSGFFGAGGTAVFHRGTVELGSAGLDLETGRLDVGPDAELAVNQGPTVIESDATLNVYGMMSIQQPQQLAGVISVTGGTLNLMPEAMAVQAASIRTTEQVLNASDPIELDSSSHLSITGGVLNSDTPIHNRGRLNFNQAIINAPLDIGSLTDVTLVGRVSFLQDFAGRGELAGLADVRFERDVRLDSFDSSAPAGRLGLPHDVVLTEETRLFINLGGPAPGTQHDQLHAAGSADLDGELVLSVLDEMVLEFGQTFDILTFADRAGTFAGIEGVQREGKALAVSYAPDAVRVTVALSADTNLDGAVNVIDLGRLGLNFGQPEARWADGDLDGNGLIDVVDLGLLGLHFNRSVPMGAASAPVPAPAAVFMLLGLGMPYVLIRRRNRRGRRVLGISRSGIAIT